MKHCKKQKQRKMLNELEKVFYWAKKNEKECPELRLLYTVHETKQRGRRGRKRMERKGRKADIPSLCMPVPNCDSNGIYILLQSGWMRKGQEEYIDMLAKNRYSVYTCYNAEEVIDELERYIDRYGDMPCPYDDSETYSYCVTFDDLHEMQERMGKRKRQ